METRRYTRPVWSGLSAVGLLRRALAGRGPLSPVVRVTIIGLVAAWPPGGCTPGRVYVSQPQVNTREREVSQRLADTEWLRSQYDKVDKITTTEQGIRDSRAFSGLFAEIAASVSPSGGPLKALDTENEKLKKQTENWQLKKEELEARRRYLDQVNKESGSSSSTTDANAAAAKTKDLSNPGGGTQKDEGEVPDTKTPFGKDPNDMNKVPDPTTPVETKAKPMPLDLLHDQMAFRDALNTMIKARELDDAHDQAGMMLYDLNLNLTVVPGDRGSRYVQTTLWMEPPPRKERVRELHELFAKWRASLQVTMASEIGELQSRYLCGKLDRVDRANLEWFFTRHIGGLRLRLRDRLAAIEELEDLTDELLPPTWTPDQNEVNADAYRTWRRRCCESITDYRLFGLLDDLLKLKTSPKSENGHQDCWQRLTDCGLFDVLDSINATRDSDRPPSVDTLREFRYRLGLFREENHALVRNFNGFADRCEIGEILCSLEWKDQNELERRREVQKAVLEGIAWAVWNKYAHELARIVEIRPPVVGLDGNDSSSVRLEGLEISPVASAERRGDSDLVPTPGGCVLDEDMYISSAGECTFVHRLLESEGRLYAASVEPAEYAQNVSDVAALETLTNLVAAVQALFPPKGVTAQARFQSLHRSQEILHAIERRPLLAGFGMGQSRFGWVAGPKFAIRNRRAEFLHTPLRHDCSASIVVPAWWMRVTLRGEYSWICHDGARGGANPLWGGDGVTVNLPLARDAIQRITLALTAGGPSDEPFLLTTRPRPRIEPHGAQREDFVLQAGREDQSLVICGHDLWRSPQVFVGSQKADRVEVLSDMEGILAHFDQIHYPGSEDANAAPLAVDLLVVTAYGQYREPDAVTIRPTKPGPAATLKTRFVDDVSTRLTFSYPRPESAARLIAKTRRKDSGDGFGKTFTDASWNEKGTEVSFTFKDESPQNEIMVADLILCSGPSSQDGISLLKGGPAPFVRFKSKEDRSLRACTTTIQFRVHDETDRPLTLACPSGLLPLVPTAYPGLREAMQRAGAMRLALRGPNGQKGPEFPLSVDTTSGETPSFQVTRKDLAHCQTEILGKAQEASWDIRTGFVDKTGAYAEIPVFDGPGNKASVSFTREPSGLKASVQPASISFKDPDKVNEMVVTIWMSEDPFRKCRGLEESVKAGQARIILIGQGGCGLTELPARAEKGTTELHLRVQPKELLAPDLKAELLDPVRDPWMIAVSGHDSSRCSEWVDLVDGNGKPLRISFKKD